MPERDGNSSSSSCVWISCSCFLDSLSSCCSCCYCCSWSVQRARFVSFFVCFLLSFLCFSRCFLIWFPFFLLFLPINSFGFVLFPHRKSTLTLIMIRPAPLCCLYAHGSLCRSRRFSLPLPLFLLLAFAVAAALFLLLLLVLLHRSIIAPHSSPSSCSSSRR